MFQIGKLSTYLSFRILTVTSVTPTPQFSLASHSDHSIGVRNPFSRFANAPKKCLELRRENLTMADNTD